MKLWWKKDKGATEAATPAEPGATDRISIDPPVSAQPAGEADKLGDADRPAPLPLTALLPEMPSVLARFHSAEEPPVIAPMIEPVMEAPQVVVPEPVVAPVLVPLTDPVAEPPRSALFAPAPAVNMEVEAADIEDGSWLSRLSRGLSKSTSRFSENIGDLFTKQKLDQATLDGLEDALVMADVGPKTAAAIVADFGRDRFGKDMSESDIRRALAGSIATILEKVARPLDLSPLPDGPRVVLICGVNGVGKTTTIGKIAYELSARQGRKVLVAAGDTFRAAAGEQLEIWAQRAKCAILRKETGADSAAVAFEAYERAQREGAEVVLIDTAGRLHNKSNLMAELEKIIRVLKKRNENLPHAVVLVLDATTGQNAVEQVRIFRELVHVTGLVVTKLDGSARGGIVVALADQFGLPIHLIGVGETAEDLRPFQPMDYAQSLVGVVNAHG